jgi:hypothetical protein
MIYIIMQRTCTEEKRIYIPNGNPSASSPNPCKKIKVAGRAAFLSTASRMKGGFCAMVD